MADPTIRERLRRVSKPAPPHNGLLAPALCGCHECSKIILSLRCPVRHAQGQCGRYRHRGNRHSLLVATAFDIAEERVRLDGPTFAVTP